MPSLLKLLSFVFFAATFVSQATALTLTTKQNFKLKGDYFQPQHATDRAVLLLHQCNFNRTMYDDIGQKLSLKGIHALSIDFRWFGESIDEQTDIKVLAKLPTAERKNPWAMVMKHWPEDVQLAYDFLRNKVGKHGVIGVTGASCGGRQAKFLVNNNPVSAIAFFSSAVVSRNDEKSIVNYKATLAKKPTLFISAEKDGTFAGTQKGFSLNENINSKFISYKGDKHGYPLLEQDKHLASIIAAWFDDNLIKNDVIFRHRR